MVQKNENVGQTAQQRTYESIRDAIIAGLFVPGEVVTLRALAERFGVSPMPVREALRRLIAEGGFESLPNHSARVPLPSRQEVEQVAELRRLLEARALVLAAEHLSKHKLDQLTDLSRRMKALSYPKDVSEYALLNRDFHFGIYREAQNPVLLRLIQSLWLRMAPLVNAMGFAAAREGRTTVRFADANHLRIIDCLRVHDTHGAVAALEADLSIPFGLPDYDDVARKSVRPGPRPKHAKVRRGRSST